MRAVDLSVVALGKIASLGLGVLFDQTKAAVIRAQASTLTS